MGTNYYLKVNTCECCNRPEEKIHIGKSSAGWVFLLRLDLPMGMIALGNYITAMDKPGNVVVNEYDEVISPVNMLSTIVNREKIRKGAWTPTLLAQNNAILGPRNLARPIIDNNFCVGYPPDDATYAFVKGDFC